MDVDISSMNVILSMSHLSTQDVNCPIVLRPQWSVNSMLSHKALTKEWTLECFWVAGNRIMEILGMCTLD